MQFLSCQQGFSLVIGNKTAEREIFVYIIGAQKMTSQSVVH
jgi:hypothetical protein